MVIELALTQLYWYLVFANRKEMLETTFGVSFYLKAKKGSKSQDRYIFLRLTVDGQTRDISTKIIWQTTRWNQKAGKALGSKEDAKRVNNYLDSLKMKVLQSKQALIDKGKDITADSIKNLLLGRTEEYKKLIDVFEDHNNRMKSLVGSEYTSGTLKRFETALSHTQDFIQWKFGKPDIELRKLDYDFVVDFEYWFKSVRKCSHNTSMKYLTNLKKIVLSCVKRGWLPKDPFSEYSMATKEVIRESLSEDELARVSKRVFSMDRLNQVKDIFVFCCYTGLAYIDVKKLSVADLFTGIDGELWISIYRQKTGAPSRLPLLPQALSILKKYENYPCREISGKLFPVLSNQKMNAYLKEIGDLCEITKPLTSHIARHTFATTVTLGNGIPIETVSKMLGHKSLQHTQHYAKIRDNKISQEMMTLKNKFN